MVRHIDVASLGDTRRPLRSWWAQAYEKPHWPFKSSYAEHDFDLMQTAEFFLSRLHVVQEYKVRFWFDDDRCVAATPFARFDHTGGAWTFAFELAILSPQLVTPLGYRLDSMLDMVPRPFFLNDSPIIDRCLGLLPDEAISPHWPTWMMPTESGVELLPKNFAAFLENRTKKHRYAITSNLRRNADLACCFEARYDPTVTLWSDLSSYWLRKSGTTDYVYHPEITQWHRDYLFPWFAQRNQLRTLSVTLNKKLIAYNVGVLIGRMFYDYVCLRDEEYEDRGLGTYCITQNLLHMDARYSEWPLWYNLSLPLLQYKRVFIQNPEKVMTFAAFNTMEEAIDMEADPPFVVGNTLVTDVPRQTLLPLEAP